MKRPMRRYKADPIYCATCGDRIEPTSYGWRHARPIKITDPSWHAAKP